MNKKFSVLLFALIIIGPVFLACDATAFPIVYSPIIEKGEWELEAKGSYSFDKHVEKDELQEQEYSLGYGVTDHWFTEVVGDLENSADESLNFEGVEWENIFQPFEQGQYWLDLGFLASYQFSRKNTDPDQLETRLLLQKETGEFVHTANLILEKKIGGKTPDDEEKEKRGWEGGVAWQTRYRLREYLEPGIEIFYNYGQFNQHPKPNDQELQIGPVISGKILKNIKYNVGYLFGASDAVPAGELKWILEYELRF